jgi:uncharacterized protein DUF6398
VTNRASLDRVADLRVPSTARPATAAVLAITDAFSAEHLDPEYAELCRDLVGRLARKRTSPLTRGRTEIRAAGVIYAIGSLNFLFDRSQQPHMTADQLAAALGVAKTTMANKAALIRKQLGLGWFEPELMRHGILEQNPMAWLVAVNGSIVDARSLPAELQDEARRRGLIPDLDRRAA